MFFDLPSSAVVVRQASLCASIIPDDGGRHLSGIEHFEGIFPTAQPVPTGKLFRKADTKRCW